MEKNGNQNLPEIEALEQGLPVREARPADGLDPYGRKYWDMPEFARGCITYEPNTCGAQFECPHVTEAYQSTKINDQHTMDRLIYAYNLLAECYGLEMDFNMINDLQYAKGLSELRVFFENPDEVRDIWKAYMQWEFNKGEHPTQAIEELRAKAA